MRITIVVFMLAIGVWLGSISHAQPENHQPEALTAAYSYFGDDECSQAKCQSYGWWLGGILRDANEPNLHEFSKSASNDEVVWRIVVTPSFSTDTVYRVEVDPSGQKVLTAKHLAKRLDIEDGWGVWRYSLLEEKNVRLITEDWAQISTQLDPELFQAAEADCDSFRDGTTIFVEYAAAGIHRVFACQIYGDEIFSEVSAALAQHVIWSGWRSGKGAPQWRRYLLDPPSCLKQPIPVLPVRLWVLAQAWTCRDRAQSL